MTKSCAIILELDGVLCDDSKRRHLIDRECEYEIDHLNFSMNCIKVGSLDETGGVLKNKNIHGWRPDYESYHAACSEDGVNESIRRIYWGINEPIPFQFQIYVIFICDRPDKYRKVTCDWLDKMIGHDGKKYLFMRPEFLDEARSCFNGKMCGESRQDTRPSHMVKQEIYEREIQDKYEILFVIDKGEDADMWKSLGLIVLEVK